ncbi:PD-(D/E)XK nuclease family protein [Jeotgalibacillus terrae]|uniref:PD-(D/E)XK nuclease family protein n=1 Tax=Jeotgalibacillus terrae TaxID=587735 RepID=A0ABW5ZDE2_9BACL|nr:PD-(D/E)XK nuclease family protein [Jeotgalibacillus terrae]MBM7577844.1 hypothetical protein [Jeotgalibacillus terrae]
MNKICPKCNGNLIETVIEDLHIENEQTTVQTDEVLKCENCDYSIMNGSFPMVIAVRDENTLLVQVSQTHAQILDIRDKVVFPAMYADAILSKGYWEEPERNYNVETLLAEARPAGFSEEKPNIFKFATGELTQDAFLKWLLSWAHPDFQYTEPTLHAAGKDLLGELFNLHGVPLPYVHDLRIELQHKKIDLLIKVNDQYVILIEDKTFTSNHSDQLVKYMTYASEAFSDYTILPVYFKIADQSHYKSVTAAGFKPFRRTRLLNFLHRHQQVGHPLFEDYASYINEIEDKVQAYRTTSPATWSGEAWQGFYQELQQHMSGNWGYVPNARGGFWGFWWGVEGSDHYYLLEQDKLRAKMNTKSYPDINPEEYAVKLVKNELPITLKKPNTIRKGKDITLAGNERYLEFDDQGMVDVKRTAEVLSAMK